MAGLPLLIITVMAASLAAPSGADLHQDKRRLLESERGELLAQIEDSSWMQDHGRATLARLSVERGWRRCAENEAAALATASEKPARLLAEEAIVTCKKWESLLRLALDKGAYPYLNGQVSRDDMVTQARLESRDSALARISMWRAGSLASSKDDDGPAKEPERLEVPSLVRETRPNPAPPPAAKTGTPAAEEGETIVVTATRLGGCRVRLADRTLTERELEANAKQWAANSTPLRVVRPAGADYRCLAKIVWSLSKYGVTLFHFVEPSEAR